jgi:hypothetical protein
MAGSAARRPFPQIGHTVVFSHKYSSSNARPSFGILRVFAKMNSAPEILHQAARYAPRPLSSIGASV